MKTRLKERYHLPAAIVAGFALTIGIGYVGKAIKGYNSSEYEGREILLPDRDILNEERGHEKYKDRTEERKQGVSLRKLSERKGENQF